LESAKAGDIFRLVDQFVDNYSQRFRSQWRRWPDMIVHAGNVACGQRLLCRGARIRRHGQVQFLDPRHHRGGVDAAGVGATIVNDEVGKPGRGSGYSGEPHNDRN
jgi:hypothetical protein